MYRKILSLILLKGKGGFQSNSAAPRTRPGVAVCAVQWFASNKSVCIQFAHHSELWMPISLFSTPSMAGRLTYLVRTSWRKMFCTALNGTKKTQNSIDIFQKVKKALHCTLPATAPNVISLERDSIYVRQCWSVGWSVTLWRDKLKTIWLTASLTRLSSGLWFQSRPLLRLTPCPVLMLVTFPSLQTSSCKTSPLPRLGPSLVRCPREHPGQVGGRAPRSKSIHTFMHFLFNLLVLGLTLM